MAVFLPARVPARPDRADLRAVRAGDRGDRASISAVNAATLKPTQCATWLRPPGAAGKDATSSIAASMPLYQRAENGYAGLIGSMVRHSVHHVTDRAGDHRRRRLRHVAGGDRLPADRGSGLSARRRATSGWRRTWADPGGAADRSRRSPRKRRASPGDHHHRRLGARQQLHAAPMPASPTSC